MRVVIALLLALVCAACSTDQTRQPADDSEPVLSRDATPVRAGEPPLYRGRLIAHGQPIPIDTPDVTSVKVETPVVITVDTPAVITADTSKRGSVRRDTAAKAAATIPRKEIPLPEFPFQAIETPDFMFVPRGPLMAILRTPMTYRIGNTNDSIVVPAGFVTDFASVPRWMWSRLSPLDDYKLAAIVHDYLYWYQPCTKDEADNLLFIAMTEEDVPASDRRWVYQGVHRFGGPAWRNNPIERDGGGLKVIPTDARPGPVDTWRSFEAMLRRRGVRGQSGQMPRQSYCSYGRSQDVPMTGSHPRQISRR